MKRLLPLLSLLALAACDDFALPGAARIPDGSPPIVRSTDRGTAMLTIIACPFAPGGAQILSEFLQTLQTAAPVVTATSRATSRLVINTCASPPDADMVRAAAALRRTR